eukprot:gb/GECH01003105.1/.p1 GENE.gb/GECH01003105.1/~~gb/GECH01003105.1/.p1  ORF type:complete len:664 (+),score=199.39 gb/GECH01003105.1/:1-1992(+)
MNVTRHNFRRAAQIIDDLLPETEFISIDMEFSGLFSSQLMRTLPSDTKRIRFLKTKDSAENFTVLQFGLCLWIRISSNDSSQVYAAPFTFHLIPARDGTLSNFTFSTDAVRFLSEHEFDFNLCLKDGIPFVDAAEEHRLRNVVTRKNGRMSMLRNPRDELFIEKMEEIIMEWINEKNGYNRFAEQEYHNEPFDNSLSSNRSSSSSSIHSQPNWMKNNSNTLRMCVLPYCNGWQRMLIYRVLRPKYPNILFQAFQPRSGDSQHKTVRLVTLIPQYLHYLDYAQLEGYNEIRNNIEFEKEINEMDRERILQFVLDVNKQRKQQIEFDMSEQQKHERNIMDQIGFRHIFKRICEFLSDKNQQLKSENPDPHFIYSGCIVAHNALQDFCHMLHQFEENIPSSIHEFGQKITELFPQIIDTKHVLHRHKDLFPNINLQDTSLPKIYETLSSHFYAPELRIHPRLSAQVNQDSKSPSSMILHNAGYDAMITGHAFSCICSVLDETEQELNSSINHIHIMHYEEPLRLLPPDSMEDDNDKNSMRSDIFYITGITGDLGFQMSVAETVSFFFHHFHLIQSETRTSATHHNPAQILQQLSDIQVFPVNKDSGILKIGNAWLCRNISKWFQDHPNQPFPSEAKDRSENQEVNLTDNIELYPFTAYINEFFPKT